ncbi:glycosyltransferase family 4 protein [Streptomyces sp. NPDC008001]|uniref:glycosyltransferase family 4 protein n=1 Tax=Streptomyces sp. NPDC008001 TaxID=3364804 RepID=UPI0036E17A1A
MKIEFLLHNAYGIGGTIRSTVNLAAALADRHEVRIISVNRPADDPELAIDPRVRLTPLVDLREGSDSDEYEAPLNQQPSEIFRDERIDNGRMAATALTDERVRGHLAATDADVVIATRPKLIGYLAKYGSDRYLRLGQEHLTHEAHVPELHAVMDPAISALDAFTTVSEADAGHYRDALPGARARILAVPNAVPAPVAEPSDGTSKLIVSAGRLVAVKRYDRLIAAFAKVAAERPDWHLRIYGRGPAKAKLRKQIEELGLYERITLMGARSPIETEWSKGAVAAVASDAESFGMTIVEAMHAGLPVVATDCPYGPREILTDGTDGVLVPLGGPGDTSDAVDAYADALLKITGDAGLRARLGVAARETAGRYEPSRIAARYEELFEELRPGSTTTAEKKKGLFGGLFGGGRKKQAAVAAPAPGSAAHPEARCAVAADGSLVVRLRADELTAADTHLLLRHRGTKGKESVRVPLPARREPGTWVEARLDRTAHALPEGRWDTYAERSGDKSRRRLTAALVEQKALLGLDLARTAAGVAAVVPYETSDGFLAVRTWLRPEHAEATEVGVGEDGIRVAVRLYGAEPGEGGELIARLRHGDGSVGDVRAPLADGSGLLPYEPMQRRQKPEEEQDLWDLWVRPKAGAALVRVGRLSGDFADRKGIDTFPGAVRGEVRLRPYFTVTNDLTITVKDVAQEDA